MHLAESGRRGLTVILFFFSSRTIKSVLFLRYKLKPYQDSCIFKEGTFLIGREDWTSEGRVSQNKKSTLGDGQPQFKKVLRESQAFFHSRLCACVHAGTTLRSFFCISPNY